jgi:hypothetical protein
MHAVLLDEHHPVLQTNVLANVFSEDDARLDAVVREEANPVGVGADVY